MEFESVCCTATSEQMSTVSNLSFRLKPSEILMLRSDTDSEHTPIADLGLGLVSPNCGVVRFMGESWSDMDAFDEAASRGRIGCLFEKPSWISNLSVIENIKLRERHHTHRDENSIEEEAFKLVAEAGISDYEDIYLRPDAVRHRRLRQYEWVRAAMGKPVVMLMAYPERGAPSNALDSLIVLVKHVAASGTAVVWMTDRDDILNHSDLCEWQIKIENKMKDENETEI